MTCKVELGKPGSPGDGSRCLFRILGGTRVCLWGGLGDCWTGSWRTRSRERVFNDPAHLKAIDKILILQDSISHKHFTSQALGLFRKATSLIIQ